MLLHSAVNNSKDIVPAAVPGATNVFGFDASLVAWLSVTLLWMGAAYFLVTMRGSLRAPHLPVATMPEDAMQDIERQIAAAQVNTTNPRLRTALRAPKPITFDPADHH